MASNTTKVVAEVGTHRWLREELGHRVERRIRASTYARIEGANIVVRAWGTPIFKITPSNTITLDTQMHRTPGVKARMNDLLPEGVRVHAVDRIWYVVANNGRHVFFDGIKIDCAGNVIYYGKGADHGI